MPVWAILLILGVSVEFFSGVIGIINMVTNPFGDGMFVRHGVTMIGAAFGSLLIALGVILFIIQLIG